MKVAGVLLAAGSATRMGRNKLLLELDGEPLVRRAARAAIEAGLEPVLVVLGHEGERVGEALRGLTCELVRNPDHAGGINTSLSAGIAAVPPDCAAAVVLLGDMPLVGAAQIGALLARWRETGAPLVASRYGAAQAPPTLYGRALLGELVGGQGEGRGREVVLRHRGDAAFVAQPEATLPDVDVPEDLLRVGVST